MTTLGLIGAGAIAQAWLQAAEDIADLRIAAVCDTNPAIRDSAAERIGGHAYATPEDMFAAETLDGVIIAAPPLYHPDIAIAAMEAGLPVLCEKPLTIDAASAERMIAAARRTGVTIAMASKFRYVPDIIKAKSLLDSGVIGKPMLVENLFAAPVDMQGRWNSDPAVSGGGVLIDNGTHSVEIVRYLAGPIRRVRAVTEVFAQGLPVDDTAMAFTVSDTGIRGHIELSWTIPKKSPAFVTVYGSGGALEIGWQQSRYKRGNDAEWTVFGTGYDKLVAFRHNLEDFRAAIVDGKPMRTTMQDALASVRVIEAAYASASIGGWQDVQGERDLKSVIAAAV